MNARLLVLALIAVYAVPANAATFSLNRIIPAAESLATARVSGITELGGTYSGDVMLEQNIDLDVTDHAIRINRWEFRVPGPEAFPVWFTAAYHELLFAIDPVESPLTSPNAFAVQFSTIPLTFLDAGGQPVSPPAALAIDNGPLDSFASIVIAPPPTAPFSDAALKLYEPLTVSLRVIPEPQAMALLLVGLSAALMAVRRS